jgi:hypothetical protein
VQRFFFQIVFVEWIPKEELLNRLLRKAPTDPRGSPEASKKDVEDDDDIVIGSSNMSLKDPVGHLDINVVSPADIVVVIHAHNTARPLQKVFT